MKYVVCWTLMLSILLFSCQKNNSEKIVLQEEEASVNERHCASYAVLQEQILADPGLAVRMQKIETVTQQVLRNPAAFRLMADGSIEIPVHVNVLYRTSAENISNAQIQSQIDVLNEDYGGMNVDKINIPALFTGVFAGDIRIKFTWDPATGLTRKSTTKSSWRTNDDMKKSTRGGIDPTSSTTKLNIWVCNLSNNILGYAQFPGGSSSTDGVVIDNNAFGRGTYSLFTTFNKGRTATHEVGHWLNLRHIWGDAACGSDLVGDTPQHNTANYGCPSYPHLSTCTGTPVEMTMNYMDYTDDACMYMFTAGQKNRMLATFATGGGRNSFAQP